MVATIEETCRAIELQMDLVWQKLPISHKFPEPLPLQSNVVCFQDRHSVERHPFSCISEAVDFALARTTLPITINGRPGGGKTSAMKWIARSFATRRLESQSKWLPIYVDLGQFRHLETGRWLASLIEQVMRKRLPVNYSPFQAEAQNLLFLLDGLDILSGKPFAREIVDDACQATSTRFIIAGRADDQVTELLNDYHSTVRIQLGPLDKVEREHWFRSHASIAAQEKYFSLITSNSHVDSLLETPLLFAMAASVCIDEEVVAPFRTDSYSGRTGIFAGFIQYAVRRSISQGNLPRGEDAVFDAHFTFVCGLLLFAARGGHRDRIPEDVISRFLTEMSVSSLPTVGGNSVAEWSRMKQILLSIGLLEYSEKTYVFLHQQFAEYMAGFGLAMCWLFATDERQLYEQLATDLRYRDRDAMISHALSVVAAHPLCERVLDAAFRMLFGVAPADLCELFSSTGSAELVRYLAPLVGTHRTDQMTWLYAIQGLAKLPHIRAIQSLEAIVTEHERYIPPLVRAAISGLAKHAMPEGEAAAVNILNAATLPDWIRLAAASTLPITRLDSGVSDFASKVALDSSRDEEVRTDAVMVIERFGPSTARSILSRLSTVPQSSIAFRLNVESAMMRLFAKERQPIPATPDPVNESLYKADLNNALWILETSALSSKTTENPVSSAAAAITRLRVLPPSMVIAEAEQLIQQLLEKGSELPLIQQLTQLCAFHPEVWKSVESHPSLPLLNKTLVQSCARTCGRRWIPAYESKLPVAPEDDPITQHQRSITPVNVALADITSGTNPSRERKTEAKLLKLDTLMIEYVKELQETGASSSIDTAIEFCKSRKSPYKKSAISANSIWKANKKRERKAKEQLKEAQEFQDEYHQDRRRD